jgi:hypothetical protein
MPIRARTASKSSAVAADVYARACRPSTCRQRANQRTKLCRVAGTLAPQRIGWERPVPRGSMSSETHHAPLRSGGERRRRARVAVAAT